MKTLQILFFVLVAILYLLAFMLAWIGFFPGEAFGSVVSQWKVVVPILTLASPVMGFVIFTLGYNPKSNLLQMVRGPLVRRLQSMRWLKSVVVVLAVLALAQGVLIAWLVRVPQMESLTLLLNGDYENAMAVADARKKNDDSERLVALVSEAEIEAARRDSSSDNDNAVERLRRQTLKYDRPFRPVWKRFLANYGLGKLAFARKNTDGLEKRFTNAANLAGWTDKTLAVKCRFATAQAFFSLSQTESDPPIKRDLLLRAKAIFQQDYSIASQRLLGSVLYIEKDFGGAIRTWKAVLDRKVDREAEGLEVPDSDERKRLLNNMALAKLEEGQAQGGLEMVMRGLAEPWNPGLESDRKEQVRLMATQISCLLLLGKPEEAMKVFESRVKVSSQLSNEGLTVGSLLLKANILAGIWRGLGENHADRPARARELLTCLLTAREEDLASYRDHSRVAYQKLIVRVATLWRWAGISFDAEGCEAAILSLLQ